MQSKFDSCVCVKEWRPCMGENRTTGAQEIGFHEWPSLGESGNCIFPWILICLLFVSRLRVCL